MTGALMAFANTDISWEVRCFPHRETAPAPPTEADHDQANTEEVGQASDARESQRPTGDA